VVGSLNLTENRLFATWVFRIVLKGIRHKNDVHLQRINFCVPHESHIVANVVVDDILNYSDDFGAPMVMMLTLANELVDISLIDVLPVQAIVWRNGHFFAGNQCPMGADVRYLVAADIEMVVGEGAI